jgi:hypothetical protein
MSHIHSPSTSASPRAQVSTIVHSCPPACFRTKLAASRADRADVRLAYRCSVSQGVFGGGAVRCRHLVTPQKASPSSRRRARRASRPPRNVVRLDQRVLQQLKSPSAQHHRRRSQHADPQQGHCHTSSQPSHAGATGTRALADHVQSSLKGRGRSVGAEPVVSVFRLLLGGCGRASPESVSRWSARSAARTNGLDTGEDGAMLAAAGNSGAPRDMGLSGSVFMCAEDQRGRAVGFGCRSSLPYLLSWVGSGQS